MRNVEHFKIYEPCQAVYYLWAVSSDFGACANKYNKNYLWY